MGWRDRMPGAGAAAAAPSTPAAAAPAPAPAAPAAAAPPPPAPAAVLPPIPAAPPPPTAPVAATVLPPDVAQQAAAAAPAAPRGRRPKTTPPPAAAAPATTAVTVATTAAVSVPATPAGSYTLAAPSAALPGFLQKFVPAAGQRSMAASLMSAAEAKGEPNLFPTNFIVGGENGGMLKIDPMNPEGSDANLADGGKPQFCVVIGNRLILNAWPEAYDKDAQNRAAPRWKAQIGQNDGESSDLVVQALKNYQFRTRALSARFDPFGHIQVAAEFLCYDDKIGLYATRTCYDYDSVVNSIAAWWKGLPDLDAAQPHLGKVFTPYPAKIEIISEAKQSKTNNWKAHSFFFQRLSGPETAAASASFTQFIADVAADEELNGLIEEWNATTLTPDHRGMLQQIAQVQAR